MSIHHQSTSKRYENKLNTEIGIKLNRNNEIIIIIHEKVDEGGDSRVVRFSQDDKILLNNFDVILANIINYANTFAKNYGLNQNTSKKGLGAFIQDNATNTIFDVTFEIGKGVIFSIIPEDSSKRVEILFAEDDYGVLAEFKTKFTQVVNNNAPKLPTFSHGHHADVSDTLHNKND